MKKALWLCFVYLATAFVACRDHENRTPGTYNTTGNNTGQTGASEMLPPDVLALAKPLIGGALYLKPDFESKVIARFDTSQVIYVLDSSDNIFTKARILQNNMLRTGFISKAILPENKKTKR